MEEDGKRSIPERVHKLYYKVFPGADCPVTGTAKDKLLEASRSQQNTPGSSSNSSSSQAGAGSQGTPYKHPHVYDVYGRRIDQQQQQQPRSPQEEPWKMPTFLYSSMFHTVVDKDEINPANRMPKHANQEPAPGQTVPLSTARQQSSIPKGGTHETWLYPSQQMFFNSLVRKGKAEGVSEEDMVSVVATHNSVNEATWMRLQQWEKLYGKLFPASSAEEPRLLHFTGRPHDLSPKARFRKMLGLGEPFDRHDWTVDRGGREMRYVIDFYYHEQPEEPAAGKERKWPFEVDVRPALDSPTAVLLRARMLVQEAMEATGVAASPAALPPQQQQQQESPAS